MNSKEVSEIMGISIDTIRYYEKVGIIPKVQKSENGYRNYRVSDLNWIYLAKKMRSAGLSIEQMVNFIRLKNEDTNTNADQKKILQDQLDVLDEKIRDMSETRAILKYKLDSFDDHLAKFDSGELNPDNVDKLWEIKFR